MKSLREAAPIPRVAGREKAGHIKSMPVRGASQSFWSNGGAMRPPIGEVGPTVVFDAAFEGGQSVCPAFDQRLPAAAI